MSKAGIILVFSVIAGLLPLRSIAALVTGPCAAVQDEIAAAQPAADTQKSEPDSTKADTHCPGPAFLANAAAAPLLAPSQARSALLVERTGPAYVPDKLERPPLSLVR